MTYKSTRDVLTDLQKTGQVLEITDEVDPHLEMAALQRIAYENNGPALYFTNIKNCTFPAVSNLFGSEQRCAYIFRKSLEQVKQAVRLKADPPGFLQNEAWRRPWQTLQLPLTALTSLPMRVKDAPVMQRKINISDLPQIVSWPDDGGAFITLPQVYSLPPGETRAVKCNIGMYRVQMSGNQYELNREVGLHYQIHRGIGIHHTAAMESGAPFKVAVAVGGPPAHTVAAVMPMPEGLSEALFAGMLARRRLRYVLRDRWIIPADADFCILGTVEGTKPEGPFGDHLGYYSLTHDFPVLKVHEVYARQDAVWPFTVVGRPPQEDTSFGALIHKITDPMVPVSLPGVKELHAIDASGVHPLLFAKGSERYTPYKKPARPQELLTQAWAILGFNQCSLAKYLWLTADSEVDINDIPGFMQHVLERIDFSRDLHFVTKTTIDTLDYSGDGLNTGSKLVLAAGGKVLRTLGAQTPAWPGLSPVLVMPGIIALSWDGDLPSLAEKIGPQDAYPLVVVTEDPAFCAASVRNFVWVTFTRSNPSHDVYGVDAGFTHKHWHCRPPLIIDARLKAHHAPPLVDDPGVLGRMQELWCKLSQGEKR